MRSQDEIRTDAAAGKRPFSNRSEFDIWADRFCYECVHDDEGKEKYCPILNVAMLGEGWPAEWTREQVPFTDIKGVERTYERVDVCTEFEERRDERDDDPEPEPEPPPEIEGQLDLIDAYVDTAIGELTTPAREVSGV